MKNSYSYLSLALIVISLISCFQKNSAELVFASQLENTDEVRMFMPGIISKRNMIHFGSSFSRNGKYIVYTIADDATPARVVIRSFEEGQFSIPKPVADDTLYSYSDASISPDGNTITLSSNRVQGSESSGSQKHGIWQFHRNKAGWDNPRRIDLDMDYIGEFFYPTLTEKETLYFAYMPDDGTRNMNIFSSKLKNGIYEKPIRLPSQINTNKFEDDPFIDSQERFLIFAGFDKEENYGKSDLYISIKLENGWSEALNMGRDINSHGYDGSPYITANDKYLIFTSSRHPEKEGEEEFFNIFYVKFNLGRYQELLTD